MHSLLTTAIVLFSFTAAGAGETIATDLDLLTFHETSEVRTLDGFEIETLYAATATEEPELTDVLDLALDKAWQVSEDFSYDLLEEVFHLVENSGSLLVGIPQLSDRSSAVALPREASLQGYLVFEESEFVSRDELFQSGTFPTDARGAIGVVRRSVNGVERDIPVFSKESFSEKVATLSTADSSTAYLHIGLSRLRAKMETPFSSSREIRYLTAVFSSEEIFNSRDEAAVRALADQLED